MYIAVTHVAWLTSLSKKINKGEAAYRLWERGLDLNRRGNQPTGPICSPLQCIFFFFTDNAISSRPLPCVAVWLFVHDLLKLKYRYVNWQMQTFQYVFSLSFFWYCLLKWVGQKENIFTITLRMGLVEKSVFKSQLLIHPTPCVPLYFHFFIWLFYPDRHTIVEQQSSCFDAKICVDWIVQWLICIKSLSFKSYAMVK